MHRRWLGVIAALSSVFFVAGCTLVFSAATRPPPPSGRIVLGHETHRTQSVICTQEQWTMAIEAKAGAGVARVALQIGGTNPTVETVNFEDIGGLNGIVSDVGKTEVTTDGRGNYTITGTAVMADPAHPGQTTDETFEIFAPC